MAIFIIILLFIAIGIYIGYKLGAWGTDTLNTTMRSEINILKAHNRHYSNEVTDKYNLSGQIAQQQTNNVSQTMHTVIQLLNTIQREQADSMSNNEQHQIAELINQAKQIAKS